MNQLGTQRSYLNRFIAVMVRVRKVVSVEKDLWVMGDVVDYDVSNFCGFKVTKIHSLHQYWQWMSKTPCRICSQQYLLIMSSIHNQCPRTMPTLALNTNRSFPSTIISKS